MIAIRGALVLMLALAGCAPPPAAGPPAPWPATIVLPPGATATITTVDPGPPKVVVAPAPVTAAPPPADTMLQTVSAVGTVSTSAKKTPAECDAARKAAAAHTELVDPASGKDHPANILSAECVTVPAPPVPTRHKRKKPPP